MSPKTQTIISNGRATFYTPDALPEWILLNQSICFILVQVVKNVSKNIFND